MTAAASWICFWGISLLIVDPATCNALTWFFLPPTVALNCSNVQNLKNLKSLDYEESVVIAELSDVLGSTIFRLAIKGYYSTCPDDEWDDWLDVDVEYASQGFSWQLKHWEINTLGLLRSFNAVKGFQGYDQSPQLLMDDYTGRDRLFMIYKPPHVRLEKWAKVFRRRSGHFVKAEFGSIRCPSFEFKVDRMQLLKFEKKLGEAVKRYPIRSKKFRAMLEGKPYWK